MRVGAWCWLEAGDGLRLAGRLDSHAAALLLEQAERRRAPRRIVAPELAMTGDAAAALAHALPPLFAAAHNRSVVHDMRNRLAALRLRLQLLGSETALPGPAVANAIAGIDELTQVVGRLAP